jgi:hypothetical protein
MHNNTSSSSSSSSSSSHKTPQQPARNKNLLQRPVSNVDRPCKAIMLSKSDLGKTKQKKPKYLQNPNQMDTITSVAETKAFTSEAENTQKKKKQMKRQKEKERKQNSVTQRRNGTKKTKKSFAAK